MASPGSSAARSAAAARRLRGAKPPVDPWTLLDRVRELELEPDGQQRASTTFFIAGAECPFTCVFCDLWRYTTDGVTLDGAIPAQIRQGLQALRSELGETTGHVAEAGSRLLGWNPAEEILKLYNASNFFDSHSVPEADDREIARQVAAFARLVVECHPRFVGRRAFRFAELLEGRLEVAMGFETAHPEALARLRKGIDRHDLSRAASALHRAGIDLRAFVLVGAPFVPLDEELPWLRRSVELALEAGARMVCLIPIRGGEAEMAQLQAEGWVLPPDLDRVEAAWEYCRPLAPRSIRLDTWDLERLVPHLSADAKADPSSADTAKIDALQRIELLRKAQLTIPESCPPPAEHAR